MTIPVFVEVQAGGNVWPGRRMVNVVEISELVESAESKTCTMLLRGQKWPMRIMEPYSIVRGRIVEAICDAAASEG
jgi:hypothetical protein